MRRIAPAQNEKMGKLGEVDRGPRGKNEIALTFDAGAEAECFDDLITALANAHVSSTFFITGRFVHDHADCAAEITKHGHEVGNHTWSHLNLTEQSDEVVRDEIMRAERAIVQVSGQTPRPRFRAPYGIRDERVLKIASNLGYRSIYWTLDSQDGVEPAKTPQFLIDRITSKSDARPRRRHHFNACRRSQHCGRVAGNNRQSCKGVVSVSSRSRSFWSLRPNRNKIRDARNARQFAIAAKREFTDA